MGIATPGTHIVGYFTEKECGNTFEYVDNDEVFLSPLAHGGKSVVFPHKIFVGPLSETRHAFVKGSVAHVVTDEYSYEGRTFYKVEKWYITKHKKLS